MPTIKLYTVQLAKWRLVRELGITLLDITAKSGAPCFAPRFEDVMAYKHNELTEEDYTDRYLLRMRQSRRDQPEEWEKLKTLSDRIALACYCKPGVFCHRHLFRDLLVDYLKDARFEVECQGELTGLLPTKTS
jgi:uncharacterized protein YeaO (DUF488 family)